MCDKIKERVENFQKVLKDNVPCLIIIVSFIFLIPEACIEFALLGSEDTAINNGFKFLSYIGSTMLVTGVYGVFSKSFFFKDIYSSMLTDIFYGTDNLKRKSEQELESIWCRVSECMYKSKRFSDINEAVEKHVLSSYLPSKQPYYFKNNKTVIDYSWDEENEGYIIVTEEASFSVVGIESEYVGRIHRFNLHIDFSKEDGNSYIELLTYEVDGKVMSLPKDNQVSNDSEGRMRLECNVSNTETSITKTYTLYIDKNIDKDKNNEHSVHYKITQKVQLYNNKLKRSVCKRIVDGWDVTVRYQNNMKVEFLELGLLKDFESVYESDGLMCRKYEDLVFPYQGYLLFVDTIDTK